MGRLHELAAKYGTDKLEHGYIDFYEEHLPKDPVSLLEIGVKNGASIRMWKEYFPDTEIHGLDLFNEFPIPDINGVTFHKGNQLDHNILYHIRNNIKPTIIIDDGSHNCADHWVTLMSLIGGCKYYFIEDLHTCNEEFYRQGLTFQQTILGCAENVFKGAWLDCQTQKIIKIYGNL